MNNIILAILAISVVSAFPLIGDVYAQTTQPDLQVKDDTAKVIGPNLVEIEFNKAVNDNKDIFSFTTADGDTRFVTNTRGDTKITLTISGEPLGTDATGTINFIKDLSPRVNNGSGSDSISAGTTASVSDGQIPEIKSKKVVSSDTVLIVFSEVIDDTNVDNFNNLRFGSISSNISGTETSSVNSNSTGSSSSATVTIVFSGKTIPNDATGSVELKGIQDTAGNEFPDGVVQIEAGQIPEVESVEVTGVDTVVVTFSEVLQDEDGTSTVFVDDFSNLRLMKNGQYTSVNISGFSLSNDPVTVVTLTTSGEDLPNGAEGKIRIESHDGESLVDNEGNMVEGKDYDVKDGIPPTYVSSTLTSKNMIEVKFSEDVTVSNNAFTFDDGTGVDSSPNIVNILKNGTSSITLVLSNANISPDNPSPGTLIVTPSMVTDLNEKPLTDPGSITVDPGIAPSFESARITGFVGITSDNVESDDTTIITVTFSEAVEMESPSYTTFEFVQRGKSAPETQSRTLPIVNPDNDKQILVYIDGHLDVTTVGEIKITSGVQNDATDVDFKEMSYPVDAGQIPEIDSIKINTPSTVLVTFSEPVKANEQNFYDFRLIGDGIASNVRVIDDVSITNDDDGDGFSTTYTLTFTNADFPTNSKGEISLKHTEVTNGTTTTKYLADLDGNFVNDVTGENVDDGQAPTIKSARSIASNLVELVFSEEINVDNDNFVGFMINDTSPRNIVNVVGDKRDTIRLEIGGTGLSPTDTATVVLVPTKSGLTDLAENEFDSTPPTNDSNLITTTGTVIKVTITPDQIPKVISAKITAPNTLTVEFNNAVYATRDSFDDFMVDVNGETSSRILSNLNGNGTTMIELNISGQGLPANAEGTVVIKDSVAGVESNASFVETTVNVDPGQPPTVMEAKIIDYNKISLKFSEEVNVVSGSFTGIKINSKDANVVDYTGNDTVDIIIELDTERDNIPYNATGVIDVGVGVTNTDTGVSIVPRSGIAINDGQSPVVDYAKVTDNNTITIKFTEEVNAEASHFTKFMLNGEDSRSLADNAVGSGTNTIILTVVGDDLAPDAEGTIEITDSITDINGNKFNPSSFDGDVDPGQIPDLDMAVVGSHNSIIVKFTEPVRVVENDFTNLRIDQKSINIVSFSGSETDTITLFVSDETLTETSTGFVDVKGSITDIAGNLLASAYPDTIVNVDAPPEIESAEITGINNVTIVFSEPVTEVVVNNFTNFEVKNDDGDYDRRNIKDIHGSGTNTIILVVSGDERLPPDATGRIDIESGSTGSGADQTFITLIDRNGQPIIGDENSSSKYDDYPVSDGQPETTVTVMGTISHADGTGISGAIVFIDDSRSMSNSDGTYSITNLLAGTYTMRVVTPTGLSETRSVTIPSADPVNFSLGVIPSIVGTVNDTNGNGVAGVTIKTLSGSSTTTDENGMYSFENIDAGKQDVYIMTPDGYTLEGESFLQTVSVTEGESITVDFVLRNTQVGNVTGIVSGSDGPINGATVTISTTPEDSTITQVGIFTFSNITPGSYTITITADGYIAHTEVITVTVGGETRITPTLTSEPTTGSISGVVSGSDTGLLTGVTVTITSTSTTMTATSNVGLYNFTDVPAGTYSVSFTHPDYNPGSSFVTVTVNGNATVPQTTLTPVSTVGVVRGTITDITTGSAISGATVSLGSTTTPVMTAFDGSYSFRDIEAGSYVLSVTFSGYQGTTVRILVSADSATTTNLQLTPVGTPTTTGTITGTVTDVDGNVISGAIVRLLTTPERDAVTNDLGVYAFANVPAGSYTISVEAVGFQTISETGSIQANQTTTTDITLLSINNLSAIRGMVYNDSNGNGKQDPSESGVGDVAVLLVTPAGETISYTSASDGMYMFNDLETGSYTIYIESPFVYTLVDLGELPLTVDLGL